MNLRRQGDMDRKNLLKILDLEPLTDSIEKNLKSEGADILTNILRQKMSQSGGGAGLTPEGLSQLNQATTSKPEAIQ